MTTVRVASWPPWYTPNRYIERFHAALAAHDIEHVRDLPLSAQVLKERGVDIVHLHWAEWAWQSKGKSARAQQRGVREFSRFLDEADSEGVCVVWTVHNLVTHEGDAAIDAAGFAELYARASLRIFHSAHARYEARSAFDADGAAQGDDLVMPHGNYDGVLPLPRERDVVRKELGVPAEGFLMACVGNVRGYKGIDTILHAMRDAINDDLHLVIEGRCRDDALRATLTHSADDMSRVHCRLDLVDDQRYADLLHAADVVVLPYREVTGSGALLAAFSASRAVIASDLPYFREVMLPEPNAGVIMNEGSPQGVILAIDAFRSIPADERYAAARRLADRCAWSRVVQPVAIWMRTR